MSTSSSNYDWDRGFSIDFSLTDGMSVIGQSTRRYLGDMKDMFADKDAAEKLTAESNPLVYEFYEMGTPDNPGDVAFGSSIVYPGKVGDEYFFTKGHFHTILETAEIYYCLSGTGFMLIESPEGDWQALPLTPGMAAYVPKRYAHRSINCGTESLITFFAFRGDAGHNYGTIETKGYRKLIVEKNGKPEIIDNPNWVD
ncbi:MAG: glucose-6-phosphate isomerase family protein [Eubacteriales bacterium]